MQLLELLNNRIVFIDGAMGTMIQRYQLNEEDFKGEIFKHVTQNLKGNNDLLNITKPTVIEEIHFEYLAAGADIIETNTFSANAISMADYDLVDQVKNINTAAVNCAKKARQSFYDKYGHSPKFIAGAIGPTNKTLSLSPDMNNPAFRAVSFNEVYEAYYEQIESLILAGVDLIIIETIFDTLNAKAAILAFSNYFTNTSTPKLPLIISGTITDASGRTLSGQTLEAFYISIKHAQPIAVGLNCALGAQEMTPYLKEISQIAPQSYISVYPNAGLPNAMGQYDETPEVFSSFIEPWAAAGLVNIAGGCCGSTPKHISSLVNKIKKYPPRKILSF
ncbi:MAG: homocysteine S-methyltransferase family protein [Sediminibacterium sp.]|nr:homocysteine S-methyltransferase family protein [Sediminibacterium sp.]